MPRKRKLPPNLQWRPNRENIFYQFEIDGGRYAGSTGTTDVLKAQEFVDDKVDKAYRDIRLGIKEKQDIYFSEAFEIAADIRMWRGDTLDRYAADKSYIINAYGDFKLSVIDGTFSSKYEKKR